MNIYIPVLITRRAKTINTRKWGLQVDKFEQVSSLGHQMSIVGTDWGQGLGAYTDGGLELRGPVQWGPLYGEVTSSGYW